jgi:hypothetical protein
MFAFVVYAIAVWYFAFQWRRRWESLAVVGAGALGVVLVAWLHWLLYVWSGGRIQVAVLQSMLYPYGLLVVGVGFYLACLPSALSPAVRCLRCDYDMRSLDEPDAICPECGQRLHPPRHPAVRINPAAPARKRRRRGPAPVVLRWPPVAGPAAATATDRR